MTTSLLVEPCCPQCIHSLGDPCPDLVACLDHGPICHQDAACAALRAERLATARYAGRTVLFVGAGTCGRANGALHVMSKAKAYIEARALPVAIVEVGCVGFCQREVFVDLQDGDGLRLSYCDVTPENTEELLDELFAKRTLRNRFLYGRYPGPNGSAAEYDDIPLVGGTPFFARQTRVVLENCGLVDPASLDAALAAGGGGAPPPGGGAGPPARGGGGL
jgi:hypothetical protein